jgi:hypothetical protein
MSQGRLRQLFLTHDAQRHIERSMKQWMSLRKGEEDRRQHLSAQNKAVLHKWTLSEPHSPDEKALVMAKVKEVVAVLDESTALGKQNNEEFAQCTEDLARASHLGGAERQRALERLQSEVDRIIAVELPKRSSILDTFEQKGQELIGLIRRLLSSAS